MLFLIALKRLPIEPTLLLVGHEVGDGLAIAGDHYRLAFLGKPRQFRKPVFGVFDRYGGHIS